MPKPNLNEAPAALVPEAGAKPQRATVSKGDLPDQLVDTTARMLRCLGHPLRLRIIDLLERCDECTVSEIQDALEVEQAVCSQHLNLMRDKGILARRKDGVNVYYRLGDPRAVKVLMCLRGSLQSHS
jgi:DNA-binding transcriptional ArsR family regulator